MSYVKLFDPTGLEDLRSNEEKRQAASGDRRDGKVYVYDDGGEIVMAVNIALATGRPLLISGTSGGGKSSLAQHVARVLGRRYYEFVVTARTQAQDLTWRFDAVRRLADAQLSGRNLQPHSLASIYTYIEPQVLWWIFDRTSAFERGRSLGVIPERQTIEPTADQTDADDLSHEWHRKPTDPVRWEPRHVDPTREWLPEAPQMDSCVLLIDEIDKADPDVPNNLLVELGSLQFEVDLIGRPVRFQGRRDDWHDRPLVIITTNKERPLPQPFVRRCIVLDIPGPKRKLLKSIAAHNFPDRDEAFFEIVLDAVQASKGAPAGAVSAGLRELGTGVSDSPAHPLNSRDDEITNISIAEYIDTVRSCAILSSRPGELTQGLLASIVKRTTWSTKERSLRPQ